MSQKDDSIEARIRPAMFWLFAIFTSGIE